MDLHFLCAPCALLALVHRLEFILPGAVLAESSTMKGNDGLGREQRMVDKTPAMIFVC